MIIITAAIRSSIFEGYDALLDEDGALWIGEKAHYDNRGHYDNSGDTAVMVTTDAEEADILFTYFGYGYLPKSARWTPNVDWKRLSSLPGCVMARKLYPSGVGR